MKVSYTILNIYRIYETKSFVIALYSNSIEYFKVDKSMTEKISKGMVFVGDKITVTQNTNDGIIFEIVNDETTGELPSAQSDAEFFYSDSKKALNESHSNLLPFLCDVLPYSNETIKEEMAKPIFKNGLFIGKYLIDQHEYSNIKIPLPSSFVAKVIHKTRINLYPTSYNPFFFAIISSNDILIKAVFWKESLKSYSSLKVGDIILVKDYKMKKKWNAVDKIELNTFTESIYFDVDEITVKELLKIKYDKKTTTQRLFETIEGQVEYLSLILRMNLNGTLMEYVLIKIDGKNVILFYNSDTEFYKIQAGSKITITEMRKITRAGYELFISTIYTQFEIIQNSLEVILPTEDNSTIKKLKPNDQEVSNSDESNIPNQNSLFNDEIDKISKSGNSIVEKSLFTQKENSIKSENKISTEKITKIEKTISYGADVNDKYLKSQQKLVFGAIGFVPDNFNNLCDITEYQDKETINRIDVSIALFFKPAVMTITEIKKQPLVLNEVKKFIVNTKILQITDFECTVSYFENNETKTQGSFQLVLEEDFKIFVYENYFIENSIDLTQFDSLEEVNIVGKDVTLAIEAFRADENSVIYYLTGLLEIK